MDLSKIADLLKYTLSSAKFGRLMYVGQTKPKPFNTQQASVSVFSGALVNY